MARTAIFWGASVLTAALTGSAVGAQGALPHSIAHYEVTHDGRSERLDVMRTGDRVEHRYLSRGITEVWTRDPRGELSHWKVFHQLQRSVHYTAGDLRTVDVEPSWEQLAALIDPAERSELRTMGTKRTALGLATVLEGWLDRQRARLLWNEATGWPQEVVLGSGHQRKRYRLRALEPCASARCDPVDTRDVREIEFADLGDMETDPFVRRFLAAFAQHGHAHPR